MMAAPKPATSAHGCRPRSGELIVRGRGPHHELHNIKAHSAKGLEAHGNAVHLHSKLDEAAGPASIRLDMVAVLGTGRRRQTSGCQAANIINDFKTDALPVIQLKAAVFQQLVFRIHRQRLFLLFSRDVIYRFQYILSHLTTSVSVCRSRLEVARTQRSEQLRRRLSLRNHFRLPTRNRSQHSALHFRAQRRQ